MIDWDKIVSLDEARMNRERLEVPEVNIGYEHRADKLREALGCFAVVVGDEILVQLHTGRVSLPADDATFVDGFISGCLFGLKC